MFIHFDNFSICWPIVLITYPSLAIILYSSIKHKQNPKANKLVRFYGWLLRFCAKNTKKITIFIAQSLLSSSITLIIILLVGFIFVSSLPKNPNPIFNYGLNTNIIVDSVLSSMWELLGKVIHLVWVLIQFIFTGVVH